MATLWIREYSSLAEANDGGPIQIGQEPGAVDQVVPFVTSSLSAAFGGSTRYIAIYGSAAFHYKISATPTAATTSMKMAADTPLYLGVRPGDKIAVITG